MRGVFDTEGTGVSAVRDAGSGTQRAKNGRLPVSHQTTGTIKLSMMMQIVSK